ncbi:UDP-2,3-diacylglucosamine diphosphatase [Silvanigrella sp.]|uniref:UDP-2,3-diacylglucosamine diphosphatase n=1 Tax=Silvanigrella sp. TaxID=2024976 RepID=UPI0037C5F2EB|nr:metallophosphoesterase [Silvanigrellaceae bacterium]
MRTIKIKEVKNFVIISDVHLREPENHITQLFIETLDKFILEKKNKTSELEAIFLLGDIFDFITVSKSFFIKLWENVFNKFLELKSLGISIYFIEGNHDFGFEHFHSKKLDKYFTDYGDCIFEFQHQNFGNVILRHGDNVVCSPTYHKPRAFFKSYLFQKIANLFFSGWLMHFICTKYAKRSRNKGEYNALQSSFLRFCITGYLNEYLEINKKQIDTLFIGHIHVFIDLNVNGTKFIVGPDWFSAPNYIHCKADGTYNRYFITNKIPSHFDF